MILSGTTIGFISVFALLATSLLIALLNKKEKQRSLSRLAVGLLVAAFVGGVAVTLVGGVQKRAAGGPTIGTVDPKEFEELRKKVAEDPRNVASRERLGHLYLQQQDFENVFKMAQEAIQINPHSVESRVHLGMILAAMGEKEKGIEQIDTALKIDPQNQEALFFKRMLNHE